MCSNYIKKCDIIHSTESWTAEYLVKLRNFFRLKPKLILSFFGFTDYWYKKKNIFDGVQQSAPHYIEDAARKGIDVSNWFCIPPAVDTDMYNHYEGLKTDMRKSLGIPENAFVILSVGSIRGKRMDYIASEIADTGIRDFHFLVAGQYESGAKYFIKKIKNTLGKRVNVLQNIPHEKMPSIYNASDLFVLANPIEIFGVVFIEAMACCLPVIGHSGNPVTSWIIGDGGYTVDIMKKGALAGMLETLYNDLEQLSHRGKKGRERVEKEFSSSVIRKKLIDMYEKVLEG
jgi:glycosyltransferase involved in cell wall biosynthesis